MTKKHHIFFLLFLCLNLTFAQQEFGKYFVDVFASDDFHGRGYVKNGNKKAADYLAEQYARFGLNPMGTSYFQNFAINVNTFPEKLTVIIEKDTLKTGFDYLVDPVSGTSIGVFEPLIITQHNLDDLANINPKNVVALDPKGLKNQDSVKLFQGLKYQLSQSVPVIYLTEQKLTWSVGTMESKNAIIELKRGLFNFDAKTIYIDIQNEFKRHHSTQNVIGKIEGKKKNKYIVVSAHYDHLGMMGGATFNGANDNASGVATMLYLAQHFAKKKPKYTMVFVAFGAEEVGLLGSKYYVNNPAFPLKKIKFLLNLDLNGTGEEGATVVNGTIHKKAFLRLTEINNEQDLLEKIKVRGPAANSDHYWFSQQGVPAFFIYTLGGVSHYHDVYDRPETLPLTEFSDLSSLLIQFLETF